MSEQQLREKIDQLFRYRKFPELLALVNQSYDDNVLISKLVDLQVAIYHLDHYLETNWNTDSQKLQGYWNEIDKQLINCGVSVELLEDYGLQIKMYQKHELGMREAIMPYDHEMSFYYFYKSCDVKLLRRIIYDHYPSLSSTYPLLDWKLFDYVTEINDDVEDVFEDCLTINGNAFLLSILDKGSAITEASFSDFIDELDRENRIQLIENYSEQLYRWTKMEIDNTASLLTDNLSKISDSNRLKSPVIAHLQRQMSMAS